MKKEFEIIHTTYSENSANIIANQYAEINPNKNVEIAKLHASYMVIATDKIRECAGA
jgi:hypothetical protein